MWLLDTLILGLGHKILFLCDCITVGRKSEGKKMVEFFKGHSEKKIMANFSHRAEKQMLKIGSLGSSTAFFISIIFLYKS